MYAVMKTGGKQYRVSKGDVLRVEKLGAEAGETVQFNDVLMVGGDEVRLGAPLVDGAAVQAEVLQQMKGPKTINFVRRRRKHSSKRTKGHRQALTEVRITDILASGGEKTGVKTAIGASLAAMSAVAGAAVATAAGAQAAVAETASTAVDAARDAVTDAARDGRRPENLLEEPRGGAGDDLSKIGGVGPKLVEKLHGIGVFHFDQIADWGPEEIAYMDDRLSFKGRIERDDWVGQAKGLAAAKE